MCEIPTGLDLSDKIDIAQAIIALFSSVIALFSAYLLFRTFRDQKDNNELEKIAKRAEYMPIIKLLSYKLILPGIENEKFIKRILSDKEVIIEVEITAQNNAFYVIDVEIKSEKLKNIKILDKGISRENIFIPDIIYFIRFSTKIGDCIDFTDIVEGTDYIKLSCSINNLESLFIMQIKDTIGNGYNLKAEFMGKNNIIRQSFIQR